MIADFYISIALPSAGTLVFCSQPCTKGNSSESSKKPWEVLACTPTVTWQTGEGFYASAVEVNRETCEEWAGPRDCFFCGW